MKINPRLMLFTLLMSVNFYLSTIKLPLKYNKNIRWIFCDLKTTSYWTTWRKKDLLAYSNSYFWSIKLLFDRYSYLIYRKVAHTRAMKLKIDDDVKYTLLCTDLFLHLFNDHSNLSKHFYWKSILICFWHAWRKKKTRLLL